MSPALNRSSAIWHLKHSDAIKIRDGIKPISVRNKPGYIITSSPGSLLKKGGGESLVTSAGKVVDFRRVIIHVVNVGRSHFSNNCHVI